MTSTENNKDVQDAEDTQRDNSFRKDNLHEIQASNADYLYRHLRIGEILDRLDRLEDKNGLEHPEPEVVIEGQPAWQRKEYLAENEVLPLFPGPDNSTPQYVEDEADFRERIASVENKPVGVAPEDRDDVDERPSAYDEGEPGTEEDGEDGEDEEVVEEDSADEKDQTAEDLGEQLSLFDESGQPTEEARRQE